MHDLKVLELLQLNGLHINLTFRNLPSPKQGLRIYIEPILALLWLRMHEIDCLKL